MTQDERSRIEDIVQQHALARLDRGPGEIGSQAGFPVNGAILGQSVETVVDIAG